MIYRLPALPYTYDALEPYIDSRTMEIHYTKHHQAYVDKLNEAFKKHPEYSDKSLIVILKSLKKLPDDIREAVRNNGGGHLNHTMFWSMMKKGGSTARQSKLTAAIAKKFGSVELMQEKLNQTAVERFGSGWAWLCVDKEGELMITSTSNQDTPFSEQLIPILGIDVWEHAYYLLYQNRRPDYLKAWWLVVNWDTIEDNYAGALGDL